MSSQTPKGIIENLLASADIHINGGQPWDIHVHNEKLYERIFQQGSLGLGEAFMDDWWDCTQLDEFFHRVLWAQLDVHFLSKQHFIPLFLHAIWPRLRAQLFNLQTPLRSLKVGHQHYDVGNDLYQFMLDSRMNYSCAYWKNCETLDEAQEAKLDLICRKLDLQPGMAVLDIGCGWGGFAKFAAEHYGVSVVGVTISKEQQRLAALICQDYPVDIRFQDYRKLDEKFDRIISIGMFEHVGYKNFGTFMDVVYRTLKDDGLFLLHTIGNNLSEVKTDKWITKYIFPNSMLPSVSQIGGACENRFIIEDWHNFGVDYDTTLMAWHRNFNYHWDKFKVQYDDRFRRMWNYYLLSCAGGFRSRTMQLWQIVLSRKGVLGGYESIR